MYARTSDLLPLISNNKEAKCLRNNHRIKNVGQLLITTERQDRNHRVRKNCPYQKCRDIRAESNCPNPHKCCNMAQTILNTLHPKWSPLHRVRADGLDLTPRRKQRNKEAWRGNGPIVFDPNITQDTLDKAIRVFIQPGAKSHLSAMWRQCWTME